MSAKATAVVYARQSFGASEAQDSTSIEVQLEQCRKWCAAHGAEVVGEFSDANCSSELYPATAAGMEACRCDRGFQQWKRQQLSKGRKEYKEGLGRAFDLIAAKRPTYIVVYTSNRLGRSATNSNLNNFITAYLMEHNCSVVEAQSGAVQDFSDKVMLAFRAMRDALDYQSVEEKRRASMASVAKRIEEFRVVSYGFGVVRKDGVITFDEEKAEAVRMVFRKTIDGATKASILHALNTSYRHLAPGRQWYESSIRRILSNLTYCGYARNRAGEIGRAINIPEPLVSYSEYRQALDADALRKAGSDKHGGRRRHHWLPWSGYLRCSCGRRMTMHLGRDGAVYYRCLNDGSHSAYVAMDATSHGQDWNLAMQSLFVIRVIESRRALEAARAADDTLDALKARQSALECELKAKMRMVRTDEDYEMLHEVIDEVRRSIAETKASILEAESRRSCDVEAAAKRLEADIRPILEGRLLPVEAYQRLLAETVEGVVILDDEAEVRLRNGMVFRLPRVKVDGRGRKTLPWSEAVTMVLRTGKARHLVVFHSGDHSGERRILAQNDDVSIVIEP